jgi:hypothetical protein
MTREPWFPRHLTTRNVWPSCLLTCPCGSLLTEQ